MPAEVGTAYVKLKGDFSGLSREVAARVSPIAKDFGGRFGKAMGPVMAQQSKHLHTFTQAAKYATVGAAGLAAYGFKDVVEAGAQFEKQMSTNAAVSEANRKQMEKLEGQSLKLGRATFFSANEAGQAQAELLKGGLKIQQVLGGGLPAALSLAEAGELDLAVAAETTVNAMKLFGLSGKDASTVADMLSTAANRTTADVLDFAMALKQGGSVTKLAGYDMNETVTILEALAEAGIKNSDAGTSMKAATIQLLKPSTKQAELAKKLNLEWVAQNGHLKSGAEISEELRRATEGMTKAERAKVLATLAGTDGVRTLNALYAEGPEKLRALEKANAKQGTAQEIAAKKMDNFAGLWEQFKGSLETTEIQIYKGMEPALSDLAEEATHAANEVGAVFDDPRLSGSQKIEGAFDVLSDEMEGAWDRHDVTEHLVDIMDAAVPAIAEHAGHLGFEAAKGFGKGFLHADPIGKAVMGAWLLNFVGGKAAFVGTGRFFGLTLGKEIAAGTAMGMASGGAASSLGSLLAGGAGAKWLGTEGSKTAFMRSQGFTVGMSEKAALAAQGGIFGGIMGGAAGKRMSGGIISTLKSVRWARIGGLGIGIGLADLVLKDFEDRANERSPKIKVAIDAKTSTALSDLPSSIFGGSDQFAAGTAFNTILSAMHKKRIQITEETIRSLAPQIRSLDLTKEQRKQVDSVFRLFREGRKLGVKVDAGMDPKKLAEIRHGFDFLKHGVGTNMADINRVTKRTGRLIATTLGKDTKEGRQLTSQNMKATAHAIEVQMDRSGKETKQGMARVKNLIRNANLIDPSRKQAQDFGREWAKGMDRSKEVTRKGVSEMIREAKRLPGPMRQVALQTWLEQAKQAKRSGDITTGEFRKLRSRVLSEFGNIQKGGKAGSKGLADGVIDNVGRMVNTTGDALQVFRDNVNAALDAFGVKAQQFELKTVGGGGGGEQRKQMGGFIVPGSGDGDKFRTMLPAGSFILNREATAAFGFNQGGPLMPVALEAKERAFMPHEVKALGGPSVLEGWNRAVPRQKGGPIGGVREPQIVGPDPLRALGQSAIRRVFEGGQEYLRKHLKAVSGGDIVAVGHSLQRLGYEVSEHPAFGGVHPVHTAGSDHYSGHAVDVNDDAPPYGHGSSEMASLDWLAPQLDKLPHRQIIWRNRDWDTGAPISGHMDHLHLAMQLGGILQKLAGGGIVENVGSILMRNGLDLESAAGILGNAWRESRWKTSAVGSGGGGLWGFTTSPISLADMQAYAESQGVSWTSGKAQTQFMLHHLPQSMRSAMNAMGSVEDTTTYFMNEWEKPGVPALSDRIAGAKKALPILRGLDGAGGGSDEHTFKEDVPAVYHGARTGSLDFPSIPKSLPGVNKEISKWQGEIKRYRQAAKKADKENKPAIAQALQKNITAINHFLMQLRNARVKLRFEKAKKKFSKGLGKRLGKVTGYETLIEGLQRDYNIANQRAEQIVGLEPQQAELPASATDTQREAAEKDYVARFTDYVNAKERPAYSDVLGKEADWRNAILRAEYFGFGKGKPSVVNLEHNWEGQIRQGEAAMEHIKAFTEKVAERLTEWRKNHSGDLPKWLKDQIKERDELRDKLPWLRFKDTELRKVLGEGRAEFYPGMKNPILRPTPPLEGSGTLEGHLEEVQGIHWPDQHELLPASALAPPREAGRFGGAIWETQSAGEELGLKIDQPASSLGSGGSESDVDNSDQEELTRQANLRFGVSEAQRVALEGWDEMRRGLTRFHEGGRAVLRSPHQREAPILIEHGETVLTEEETGRVKSAMAGGSGEPQVTVNVFEGQGKVEVEVDGELVDAVVNHPKFPSAVQRHARAGRGVGTLTPGGARR